MRPASYTHIPVGIIHSDGVIQQCHGKLVGMRVPGKDPQAAAGPEADISTELEPALPIPTLEAKIPFHIRI